MYQPGLAETSFYLFEQLCAAVERQGRKRPATVVSCAAKCSVSYKNQFTGPKAGRTMPDLSIQQWSLCCAAQQSLDTGGGT